MGFGPFQVKASFLVLPKVIVEGLMSLGVNFLLPPCIFFWLQNIELLSKSDKGGFHVKSIGHFNQYHNIVFPEGFYMH